MSTATPTTMTAVGTAKQGKGTPAAGALEQTDRPGEMPDDLAGHGWTLKEHVGENRDKFQCVNATTGKSTNPFFLPQDAIKAARTAQAKFDAKQTPAQIAGAGKGYAVARSFTQPLRVKLSPDGLQDKCAEYDAKCAEKEEMEANFQRVHDQYKKDLKKAEAEITALELIFRRQYVEVEGDCEERFHYDLKLVRIVRLDTGEVLNEREMTAVERQEKLPSL